jgi:hypothetical protein
MPSNRRWKAWEIDLLFKRYGKWKTITIARKLDRTTASLYAQVWKLKTQGYEPSKPIPPLSEKKRAVIAAMLAIKRPNFTNAEINEVFKTPELMSVAPATSAFIREFAKNGYLKKTGELQNCFIYKIVDRKKLEELLNQ